MQCKGYLGFRRVATTDMCRKRGKVWCCLNTGSTCNLGRGFSHLGRGFSHLGRGVADLDVLTAAARISGLMAETFTSCTSKWKL